MAFIPYANNLKVGDRIRLTQPLETLSGKFTVGHEFTITADGERGVDMVDDNGRQVHECGMHQKTFERVYSPSAGEEDPTLVWEFYRRETMEWCPLVSHKQAGKYEDAGYQVRAYRVVTTTAKIG